MVLQEQQEVCLMKKEASNFKNSTKTGLLVKKPTCTFSGLNVSYYNTVQFKSVATKAVSAL